LIIFLIAIMLIVIILVGCGPPTNDLAIVRVTVAAASTQTAVRAAELVHGLTQTPVDVALTYMAPTLEMAGLEHLPQYAITANSDSERGSPGWSALQAIGEPNTLECVDAVTAWEPAVQNGQGILTVAFAQLVTPVQVNVYESFNPGYVTAVEILDVYGELHAIYQAAPTPTPICPRVLTIPLEGSVDYRANVVIIYLDQATAPGGWAGIDAVQLIGTR
jgi:hypothetical protein